MTVRAPAMTSPASPSSSRVDPYAFGALAVFWGVVLIASGAIFSGYHLVDDHEIVRIAADLRQAAPWTVAWRWIAIDLAWRFRPLYFVHRVGEAAVFGDHFLAWSVYTAALCLLCSALLYRALRWLDFSPAEALAFTFFGLAGPQGAIWWRLGPNETIGMVFLAAAALAIGRHARTGSRAARAALVAAMVLASLCKESFILAIPAMLLAHAWAWRAFRAPSWAEAIRRALPEAVLLLLVMLAELAFIRLRVGTEGIGYAGLGGLTVSKALGTAWEITRFGGLWWASLVLSAIAALAGGFPRLLRAAAPAAALLAATVAPQAALYAKSGIGERYLLPGVLGPAFLVAACLRLLRTGPDRTVRVALPARLEGPAWDLAGLVLRGRVRARRAGLAVAAVVLTALAPPQVRTMYRDARGFAKGGDQAFVERLASSRASGPVLVAGGLLGVYEGFWSLQWYFDCKADRRVYFEFVEHEPRSAFADGAVDGYRRNGFFRKRDPARGPAAFAAVGVLPGDEEAFLSSAAGWFDPAAYTREVVGKKRFTVYVRR